MKVNEETMKVAAHFLLKVQFLGFVASSGPFHVTYLWLFDSQFRRLIYSPDSRVRPQICSLSASLGAALQVQDHLRPEHHLEVQTSRLDLLFRPVHHLSFPPVSSLRLTCSDYHHHCTYDDHCGDGRNGYRDVVLSRDVQVALSMVDRSWASLRAPTTTS